MCSHSSMPFDVIRQVHGLVYGQNVFKHVYKEFFQSPEVAPVIIIKRFNIF